MPEFVCQAPDCPRRGKPFSAKREAKFCTPTCRKRSHRRYGAVADPAQPVEQSKPDPPLVQRIRASLEAVDKHETWEGEMALAAAAKIAAAGTTTAQTATLMKELKATMAELTRTATPAADGRRPGIAVRGRWRNRLDDDAA